jgi:hypothetical protein
MCRNFVVVFAICVALLLASRGEAQELVESYVAFLSEADHFNSNGERLRSAAAIIRAPRKSPLAKSPRI